MAGRRTLRRTPEDLRSQIRYQTIEKIGGGWLFGTKLKLKGGDKLYLGGMPRGDRKLAVMEILFAGLSWLVFLIPTPEYPLTVGSGVFLVGIPVLFVHVPDAFGTWYLARRGVYPHRPGRAVSFSEVDAEGGGPSPLVRRDF